MCPKVNQASKWWNFSFLIGHSNIIWKRPIEKAIFKKKYFQKSYFQKSEKMVKVTIERGFHAVKGNGFFQSNLVNSVVHSYPSRIGIGLLIMRSCKEYDLARVYDPEWNFMILAESIRSLAESNLSFVENIWSDRFQFFIKLKV